MTYKAVGRSIIKYAALIWFTNLRDYRNIQYTQNEALRIATDCHKMSSVDHLHVEDEMRKVREHSEILYAQYLAVEPMMLTDNRKATFNAIHTDAVNKAVNDQKNNIIVLDALSHPINDSEKDLTMRERATLA